MTTTPAPRAPLWSRTVLCALLSGGILPSWAADPVPVTDDAPPPVEPSEPPAGNIRWPAGAARPA
ncbi:MAG TPA: hypothetical protein VIG88_06585, partial [Lysobacter sp.]